MCDGYRVYTSLAQKGGGFRLAHCWSHVRRKFLEIEASFEQEAGEVLKLIEQLFEVEALCSTGPPGEEMRTSLRESRSRPLVKEIERWALGTQTLPGSGLRGAIAYMGKLWNGLIAFLDDPRVPLHNNSSERALRSPVIGRVNYFGSRSRRGTEAAAILYSLVEAPSEPTSTRAPTSTTPPMRPCAARPSRCPTNSPSASSHFETSENPHCSAERGSARTYCSTGSKLDTWVTDRTVPQCQRSCRIN